MDERLFRLDGRAALVVSQIWHQPGLRIAPLWLHLSGVKVSSPSPPYPCALVTAPPSILERCCTTAWFYSCCDLAHRPRLTSLQSGVGPLAWSSHANPPADTSPSARVICRPFRGLASASDDRCFALRRVPSATGVQSTAALPRYIRDRSFWRFQAGRPRRRGSARYFQCACHQPTVPLRASCPCGRSSRSPSSRTVLWRYPHVSLAARPR